MRTCRTCFFALCLCSVPAIAPGQDLQVPVFVASGTPLPPPGASNVSVGLRLPLQGVDVVEVLRLGRSAADRPWQVAEITRRALKDAGAFALQAPAGLETLLLFRVGGVDGYILDGPFRWPHRPATYLVAPRWRRTVRGTWTRNGAAAPVWVGADLRTDARDPWPRCGWNSDARWECLGVPLDASGVVVSSSHGEVAYALAMAGRTAGAVEDTAAAAAPWGRLLVATITGSPGAAPPEATAGAKRVELPRARPQAIRVLATVDPSVRIERLTPAAYWLTGSTAHADTWVEVTSPGRAPARIPLRDIAGSPAEFPLRVDLEPAVAVFGRVTAGVAVPAGGTILSLFRLVPDPIAPDTRPPRRLLVAEVTANEDGTFAFNDLGMEKYDLLAMHPSLGRAEQWVEPDGHELEIALNRPVQAIGRVVRGAEPAVGVTIRVVPHIERFAASTDIGQLAGGEAHTDSEGRFAVALSSGGGGELRIGDPPGAVRRVALPDGETTLRVVDVGDVEIGEPPAVTLVLEGADGCDLMLAGPQGHAGLTIVRATRSGPAMFAARLPEAGRWLVRATCAGRERAVLPATIDVRTPEKEAVFSLAWPR